MNRYFSRGGMTYVNKKNIQKHKTSNIKNAKLVKKNKTRTNSLNF